MLFGLSNAPATFQRLIDRVIGPEHRPHAFCYLDDIIVVTETFVEHLKWFGAVLDKITQSNLTVNTEKCEFCRSEVKYLGYVVNKDGLSVNPEKTKPILTYPAQKNIKQLRRFIGLASWYRRFIPEFAVVAKPLTRLFRSNVKWHWGEEQQQALDSLKGALTSAPILAFPSFKDIVANPFHLQTDTSNTGLGVVFTQVQDGEERVISFASRTLLSAERNYSLIERECLAVVWGIRKFRDYLEGFSFKVITDHSSLKFLHNLRNPTGKVAR